MRTIFLVTLLSSGYAFAMDMSPKTLTITNNHERPVTVRYEPRKEETRVVVPTGEWSCAISRIIESKKSLTLLPLLTPHVSVAIEGFQPLQNLPIVKTHIPVVIHPQRGDTITITQDTETLAVLKSLMQTTVAQQPKAEAKEDFCSQQ